MAKAKLKQKEIETIAARAPAETHPADGPSLKSHWPEKRKLIRKMRDLYEKRLDYEILLFIFACSKSIIRQIKLILPADVIWKLLRALHGWPHKYLLQA